MRRVFCFSALIISHIYLLQGQELVYNGGFEKYYELPEDYNEIWKAVGWNEIKHDDTIFNGHNTPSYLHQDGFYGNGSITINGPRPNSGNGHIYAEFVFCSPPNYTGISNREYLGCKLHTQMLVSKKYIISFYLASRFGVPYEFEEYGLLLSTGPKRQGLEASQKWIIQGGKEVLIGPGQSSDSAYRKFSYEVEADSSYHYLSFGCFVHDSVIYEKYKPKRDWVFFLDDISVLPGWLYVTGDSSICHGRPATLKANNSHGYCRWALLDKPDEIFSNDSIISVSPEVSTTYIVYGLEDTALFTVLVKDYEVSLGNDTLICEGEEFELRPQLDGAFFKWQDGTAGPVHTVKDEGTYTVTAFKNGCRVEDSLVVTTKYCHCNLSVPNTFTPNGDGLNETFRPEFGCNLKQYTLRIYNRWGDLVFETYDEEEAWDGSPGGNPAIEGQYVYQLECITRGGYRLEKTGHVLLTR